MKKQQSNTIRIIAGEWRGRRLPVPELPGLRPSGDRTKETLFNWLQSAICDSQCLDMFAGTGGLGFEAASRGAKSVLMLESNRSACVGLEKSAEMLDARQVLISHANALQWPYRDQPAFNLIFLDPPFASGLLEKAVETIDKLDLLMPNGMVYIEQPAGHWFQVPNHWQRLKFKKVSGVDMHLYRTEK